MHELTELLIQFWIPRDTDSAAYFRIKKTIDKPLKDFLHDCLGWRILVSPHVIKLEKRPAEAYPFMGIQQFESVSDYCLLCGLLLFLDDKADGQQFLLSELIEAIEALMAGKMRIDFTRFTDRKSLVRVLKFAEAMHLLKVWEGSAERLEHNQNQEILYENTGLSDLFSVTFDTNISGFRNYHDFEQSDSLYTDRDKGYVRTNRVYRRLLLQPAMYWDSRDEPDSLYLKNQRVSVARRLDTYLEGRLDLHEQAAFYLVHEDEAVGKVHPSETSISKFAALLCGTLQEEYRETEMHRIHMTEEQYHALLFLCRTKWGKALSKQLREMPDPAFLHMVTAYLTDWMLLEKTDSGYAFRDGVYKIKGVLPKDYVLE